LTSLSKLQREGIEDDATGKIFWWAVDLEYVTFMADNVAFGEGIIWDLHCRFPVASGEI